MATKNTQDQKRGRGRPAETPKMIATMRATGAGKFAPVFTGKLPTAVQRISKLRAIGIEPKNIRVEGDTENVTVSARILVGQKVRF